MAWYAKVSHPRIIPPVEGSPPRPANVEYLIEQEHAREMPDTLGIVRDVVRMANDGVARRHELSSGGICRDKGSNLDFSLTLLIMTLYIMTYFMYSHL